MRVSFLHTNDLHGKLDEERAARLALLREETDLYFDSGDAIAAGNLGIPLKPEEVWPRFERLRLTAGVPGNRESHVLTSAFKKKLQGRTTPLLCANLRMKDGSRPLPPSLIVEANGVRVGITAAMIEMVTPRMKTQAASAYLWDPAVPALKAEAEELRPKVDLLLALTHIGYRRDHDLAEEGVFDVILGGHSHTVVERPERIGDTWLCQGGSHGRFAGVYAWEDGVLTGGLRPLSSVAGL